MARKVGQIIARRDRRWLIRVYLGRDRETNKRKYHNRTIRGPMSEAQAYLTKRLRERADRQIRMGRSNGRRPSGCSVHRGSLHSVTFQ
jgi:hypothetical protein